MNLVGLLISVLILGVIVYVVKLFVDWMEFPSPLRQIILLIVGLVVLVALLNLLGIGTNVGYGHWSLR